eukprot:TRINITY_DN14395_c0_g1_i2.p1 TRINITY_DN14395_c0_g1~~TRINITY_DN14395_c0_g1_i2.p1  ORF type:complete len:650 (+),score=108.40 TRINITY_DN14395_c0_g1_i2:94-2043(+)
MVSVMARDLKMQESDCAEVDDAARCQASICSSAPTSTGKVSSAGYFGDNAITHARLFPARKSAGAIKASPAENARAIFLGEGNFSFTHSLLRVSDEVIGDFFLGPRSFIQAESTAEPLVSSEGTFRARYASSEDADVTLEVLSTSFDSEEEVAEKYPEFVPMRTRMQTFQNFRVMHDVNAVLLEELPRQGNDAQKFDEFDFVCWNHPHLGTEDCKLHKFLLHHFLYSAKKLLRARRASGGNEHAAKVIVSLVEGQGERWEIEQVASKFNLRLESCTAFDTSLFPGYECKRNKTGKSFKNVETKRQWRPGQEGNAELGENRYAAASGEMISFVYRFVENDSSLDVKPIRDDRPSAAVAHAEKAADCSAQKKSTEPELQSVIERNRMVPASNIVAAPQCAAAEADAAADPPVVMAQIEPSKHECKLCNKTFRGPQGLFTHMRQVHELKKYEKDKVETGDGLLCDLCAAAGGSAQQKRFADKHALWQHKINKHDVDDTDASQLCGLCIETSVASDDLGARGSKAGGSSHLVRDTPAWKDGAVENIMRCEKADSCSPDSVDVVSAEDAETVKRLRDQGVEKIWLHEGFYACPTCGQSIPLEWDLADHMETLKPLLGVQAACSICAKTFIEHRALKQHFNYCKRKAVAAARTEK